MLQISAVAQMKPNSSATASPGVNLSETIASYNKLMPFEKLFLHTDKPYYSATDTIWFKAYLFNGLNNAYSAKSGLIYIELVSSNGKVVKRISIPVQVGLSWGQLALDEKTFEGGDYVLRAYTNWMQNLGEDCFFTKNISITNLKKQGWLVNQKQTIDNLNGKKIVNMDFQLKDLNNKNYGLKDLGWRIQEGQTVLTKAKVETTVDGKFKASFNLPEKAKAPLKIIIEDKASIQVIPLSVSSSGNIDLQFMPEGGHLIAGLPIKIGFKAIAQNGLGTHVEGKIVDSKNNEIVPFQSAYKGLGAFYMVPIAGEVYTAILKLADGTSKSYALPQVKTTGLNLKVVQTIEMDSVRVTVNFSADLVNGQTYHLIGLVNNVTYCEASFSATNPKIVVMLGKNIFPSGIVHFTVFNSQSQPVSERMTFVDDKDNLNISVTPSKMVYKTRDSVSLYVNLKDKNGNPVSTASLSVSVTDNNQVKLDGFENNLISNMLLTSGLKGTIESPAYYFSAEPDAAKNLDLLLLTQGWISYNWADIFKPQTVPLFNAEAEFTVSGKVTSMSNKPLPDSKVLLMASGKVSMMMDTVTNTEGRFIFKDFPKLDTVSFFVQARNAKGKISNTAVQLDEFRPATFHSKSEFLPIPWFVNTDSTVLKFVRNTDAIQKQKFSLTGNNLLDEIVVGGKKGIRNSQNLNDGEADQVINEAQISAAGEMPFVDFLIKKVTGLYLKVNKADQEFNIAGKKVNFVIDGVSVQRFFQATDGILYYDYLLDVFNNIKIKDVTGVEVMSSQGNVDSYINMLSDLSDTSTAQTFGTTAYIEITTRSGKGLFFKSMQNVASYTPVPINWPKEFYRPRYAANSIKPNVLDLRSTIFWQPHLLTSKTGDASTSFYTADKPGIYSVIIQGSNLKGLVGYKVLEIKVK
ncbi:MAG: hypothetical protein JWN56_3019 [Sphingobacteriales bacterium]|nr:hypothetical protein [Sphingobacteriales bacterium]